MMPRLYPADALEFDTNGVGVLSDAIACNVIAAFGSEELELRYPLSGIHFSDIALRSILLAKPDPFRDPQPYRVYKITKPMSGVVTVYARHVVYDLIGAMVSPFTASGVVMALQGLKANAATEIPFDFWTDKSTAGNFSVAAPSPIWSVLGGVQGSVLDVFGGEYEFDGFLVRLRSRRGADRGVSIRYGKNLTSLEQDENCANCYTGVYPYWVDNQSGLVTQLPEKVVMAAGDYSYVRILPLDLTAEYETPPTEEQLRARGKEYMEDNKIGEPTVSWKVEFVQLEQTEEYKGQALLERVALGDTVRVEFPRMSVSASARAVSARWNVLLDRYDSVTLGSVRQNLAATIAEQQKEIDSKPSQSDIAIAVDKATGSILGAKGGAVRLLDTDGDKMPDTLYIADNPDPALAKKVWRYNYEGWGASSNGYNGPFSVAATLEDGMVADFITAGVLNATLIQAGVLQSKSGDFRLNLDTGELFVGGYATTGDISSLDGDIRDLSGKIESNAADFNDFAESIHSTILDTMLESGEWTDIVQQLTALKVTSEGLGIDVAATMANLDGFLTEYHTYFTATLDGLKISKSGSQFATLLSDSKLSFTQSGQEVAYIQYNKLYITEAWVKSGLSIEAPTGGTYIRQYVDSNNVYCVQIMGG